MLENLVLTVGNSMMGDDGAGPFLAELMQADPVAGWGVLDAGTTPEDVTGQLRTMGKSGLKRLLIVDAADMAMEAGTLRFVDKEKIAELSIVSTHNIPLSFLIEQLEGDIPDILFLGIQPGVVAFYEPMTQAVMDAVHYIHQELPQGLSEIPWL